MFSKLVGKALLFLSGAGKDYKKLKRHMNNPNVKKRWNSMEQDLKDITQKFKDLEDKYGK